MTGFRMASKEVARKLANSIDLNALSSKINKRRIIENVAAVCIKH